MICENITVNEKGHLCFAGQDTTVLAARYGTPLYLMDADRIRLNCRRYSEAMKAAFGEQAGVLYAGKAASFKQMYRIMQKEGMGIDAVSVGELYTAQGAGFPMEKVYFHGNNKTDEDIAYALEHGVGTLVVDNEDELIAINRLAGEKNLRQAILLRLTPGIDPHTYEAVSTGKVDSKFGFAIETGQAEAAVKTALSLQHICLAGFHCHVGSQVFDSEAYIKCASIMLTFIKQMQDIYQYKADVLDLGGGYGVRYVEDDPEIDIAYNIQQVAAHIRSVCETLSIAVPTILLEPGRSIVADAGMTLYTVGTVKKIPGYKNYIAIDGGMTDNPRFALYGSAYTVLAANKMEQPCDLIYSVAGRCCESGDMIQNNVSLPSTIGKGDLIAVCTTGAYNYSMASSYNRFLKPAVVMLEQGDSFVAVRRETLEELVSLDV